MSKAKATKKSMTLTIAIMVGVVLGVLYGLIMPEALVTVTGLISSIYLHGLTMMIYPLVFCSLIIGIRSIGSVRKTGKIGGQALLYFCATTLFASLLGLVLPKALGLGNGINIQMQDSEVEAVAFSSLLDTLKNLIPSNPVASFAEGNMLQVLTFAIIVGITCVSLKEKAEPFVKLCESINDIAIKIIGVVMYVTPLGVFCSLALTVHSNGIETILALGGVMLALYVTYFLYIVIVYGVIIVKAIGKFSMKTFFVAILPAALNAFGTASSSATLPISKACTDEMGVPNEISSLALPLGATINMDAVAIVMTFMIVFFGNATGTPISYGTLGMVLISNALLSIGCPGVPNAAIACFAALRSIAGLPSGVMSMYISVNILADAGATCCNVVGDLACAVAMKQTCKLEDKGARKASK